MKYLGCYFGENPPRCYIFWHSIDSVVFFREQIHSENLYDNHLSRFFWSLRCSFARNTADYEISIFNLTHKVPPNTSFEIRKSLKRMPSLAYTEIDQTKYRVSSMFAFECIIWTLLHVFT